MYTFPFIIVSKTVNNIGKQPKKLKDLNSPNFYNENFRPLKKERYTDTRR